jgi:hypothetical protein
MTPTPDASPRRRAPAGFSLVEALFASALVLVMMLFILPLFTRSMVQNLSGRESSIATTHGKWTLEELYQLPLDRDVLWVGAGTLPGGDPGLQACAAWDPATHAWVNYDCATEEPVDAVAGALWGRSTTLRQYAMNDLYYDGDRALNTPLPGDTPLEFVHLREIGVSVEGERSGLLGPARQIDLVTLRGF